MITAKKARIWKWTCLVIILIQLLSLYVPLCVPLPAWCIYFCHAISIIYLLLNLTNWTLVLLIQIAMAVFSVMPLAGWFLYHKGKPVGRTLIRISEWFWLLGNGLCFAFLIIAGAIGIIVSKYFFIPVVFGVAMPILVLVGISAWYDWELFVSSLKTDRR